MVLSFVYLVFVSLLKLLLRGGRRVDVKDIEVLVLVLAEDPHEALGDGGRARRRIAHDAEDDRPE